MRTLGEKKQLMTYVPLRTYDLRPFPFSAWPVDETGVACLKCEMIEEDAERGTTIDRAWAWSRASFFLQGCGCH